jgi:hypothetical protein
MLLGFLRVDQYAGDTPRPLPALFFDLANRSPQVFDLCQRDNAVFFTP